MPSTSSHLELVDWLANSGVLNLREAHALRRRCEELGSALELGQLIAGLIAQQKLTKYQAAEIRAGRHEDLVQGNYLLLDLIRSSQMGVVFKARQTALHHVVALKILPEHVARAPDAEARFRREVEAIARLKHPRIVAACDAGRMGRTLYLAMEFIEGENLGDYVRRRGKLSLRDALQCIVQAAEGLAAAHAAGIVHRDVKPSNLMLTPEGEVKVLDLGLARFLSEEHAADNLTATEDLTGGGLLGTIDYMAPEQTRDSRKVDHRADIYGLGCTLYYLLSAVPPAPPGDWRAKCAWHENAPIPRIRNICPQSPPELQTTFDKMLARDPRQRYSSCDELRIDLLALLVNCPSEPATLRAETVLEPEPTPPPIIDPTQTGAMSRAQVETTRSSGFPRVDSSRSVRPPPPPKAKEQRPAWLIPAIAGGAAACVLVIGILIVLLMNSQSPPAKQTVAKKAAASKTGKQRLVAPSAGLASTRSFARDTRFPIGTAVPQGLRWNEELKAEMERIFPSGVESDAGRNIYSDADTAMELFFDADWYIGSGLTVSGKALQLQVRQGKFFTAEMSPEEVRTLGIVPNSVRKSADSRLRMRYRPLMKITAAELTLTPTGGTSQRITGRLKIDVLEDVEIDSASIVVECASSSSRGEGTQQLYVPLEWKKTEAGWHTIDREDQGIPIPGKFSYRLYLIAWSWNPKPGFYRVTQEYQDFFKEPVATDK